MVSDTRIINNPSKSCMEMFYRKMRPNEAKELKELHFNAVGLVQANVASIFYYADMVSKASNVHPYELTGSCPTTITTLAFFGDTAAVATAMNAVLNDMKKPSLH